MRMKMLLIIVGIMLASINVFAVDGDFIVEGNVGVGTTNLDPAYRLSVDGNVVITQAAGSNNYRGYYLEGGLSGGFVKKNGPNMHFPLILSDSVFLGGDGEGVALAWDTIWDGQWGYCEGVTYNTGTINCANYAGAMDSNDIFWIWKHGHPTAADTWCTGDCQTSRRDLKFVFDGESNDGVMGFMEDEDAFFFDDKVGIGTRTPLSKLAVNGLPTAPPSGDTSGKKGILCITNNGNIWIDTNSADGVCN